MLSIYSFLIGYMHSAFKIKEKLYKQKTLWKIFKIVPTLLAIANHALIWVKLKKAIKKKLISSFLSEY